MKSSNYIFDQLDWIIGLQVGALVVDTFKILMI